MRRLIEELRGKLQQFCGQRDCLLLLVPTGDHDTALLLKVLRDLDRHSPSNLFLLFQDDFETPEQYVSCLANRLQEEITLTNEATGPAEEKLPPLPAEMLDPARPPLERLLSGFQYVQPLVNPRRGQRYVWGMCPGVIRDLQGFLALLAQLPPRAEPASWMRGARLIARLPADFQLAQSPLAALARVQVQPWQIPPDAHEQELLAQAADPRGSQEDRMQAEVQLAYLDMAHGRHERATQRFRRALAFFQWAGLPAMEGLIINGLGDMARQKQDWSQARHWYSCAVVPAAEAGNPMLLATIVKNLAVVAVGMEDWPAAEQRYSELVEIQRGMFDEAGLADSLEWQGISQEKQGAHDQAVLSWLEGAMVCKVFELNERLPSLLDRLRHGYQRLGMDEELEQFDEEWSC